MVDDAAGNEVRAFVKEGDKFIQTQILDRVGESPNRILYDAQAQMFFGISAMSQHVFVLNNSGDKVWIDKVIRLGYLQENSYIRNIRIIDGELFLYQALVRL